MSRHLPTLTTKVLVVNVDNCRYSWQSLKIYWLHKVLLVLHGILQSWVNFSGGLDKQTNGLCIIVANEDFPEGTKWWLVNRNSSSARYMSCTSYLEQPSLVFIAYTKPHRGGLSGGERTENTTSKAKFITGRNFPPLRTTPISPSWTSKDRDESGRRGSDLVVEDMTKAWARIRTMTASTQSLLRKKC